MNILLFSDMEKFCIPVISSQKNAINCNFILLFFKNKKALIKRNEDKKYYLFLGKLFDFNVSLGSIRSKAPEEMSEY